MRGGTDKLACQWRNNLGPRPLTSKLVSATPVLLTARNAEACLLRTPLCPPFARGERRYDERAQYQAPIEDEADATLVPGSTGAADASSRPAFSSVTGCMATSGNRAKTRTIARIAAGTSM